MARNTTTTINLLSALTAVSLLGLPVAGYCQISGAQQIVPETASDPTAQWLAHLRQCLKKTRNARARFVQETQRPYTDALDTSAGNVFIRRGERLRVEYKKPERRPIISDGTNLWSWDPKTKTVVQDLAAQSLLPKLFGFLVGDHNPNDFEIAHIGGTATPQNEGPAALELRPSRRDPFVRSLVLGVTPDCPCLKRIVVVDHAGAILKFTFSNTRTNVGLADNLFTFRPPKDATILRP